MDNQNNTFKVDLVVIARVITPQVLRVLCLAKSNLGKLSISSNNIIIHHDKQKKLQIPQSISTFTIDKHSAARSRNLALELSKSEAIIFLDDDTLTNIEWANDIKRFLVKEYIDIVCFNTGSIKHTFDVSSFQNGRLFKADTAGMGIKKELINSNLQFDDSLKRAEDCDFVTAAIKQGYITWFSDTKIFDDNKNGFIKKLIIRRSNALYINKIFNKHFSSTGEVLVSPRKYFYFYRGQRIDGNAYILGSTLVLDLHKDKLELKSFKIINKDKVRIIETT